MGNLILTIVFCKLKSILKSISETTTLSLQIKKNTKICRTSICVKILIKIRINDSIKNGQTKISHIPCVNIFYLIIFSYFNEKLDTNRCPTNFGILKSKTKKL